MREVVRGVGRALAGWDEEGVGAGARERETEGGERKSQLARRTRQIRTSDWPRAHRSRCATESTVSTGIAMMGLVVWYTGPWVFKWVGGG